VPDLESVLEFDDEAARLAEIDLAGDAGELEGRLPESLHLNLAVGRMHWGGQGGEGQQRAKARGRIWMPCKRPESPSLKIAMVEHEGFRRMGSRVA
jgi:hypothetical protein